MLRSMRCAMATVILANLLRMCPFVRMEKPFDTRLFESSNGARQTKQALLTRFRRCGFKFDVTNLPRDSSIRVACCLLLLLSGHATPSHTPHLYRFLGL